MTLETAITSAGVVAVLAVNVVSFGYVYYAWYVEDIDSVDAAVPAKVNKLDVQTKKDKTDVQTKNDKTDVQMLKMSQELHKKMSEYFHIQSVRKQKNYRINLISQIYRLKNTKRKIIDKYGYYVLSAGDLKLRERQRERERDRETEREGGKENG